MTASELDGFVSVPGQVKLTSGEVIEIKRLKARQFFKLLRIITRGASHLLGNLKMANPEDFIAQLMAITIMAIPEAEEETVDFIWTMTDASDLDTKDPRRTYVWNQICGPEAEIEDWIMIIETIFSQEKDDLIGLGKRLSRLFQTAEKTGQVQKTTPSSEDSQEDSTSSQVSMVGATTKS